MRLPRVLRYLASLLLLVAVEVGTSADDAPASSVFGVGPCRRFRRLLESRGGAGQRGGGGEARAPLAGSASLCRRAAQTTIGDECPSEVDGGGKHGVPWHNMPTAGAHATLNLKGGAGLDWVEQRLNSIFNSGGASRGASSRRSLSPDVGERPGSMGGEPGWGKADAEPGRGARAGGGGAADWGGKLDAFDDAFQTVRRGGEGRMHDAMSSVSPDAEIGAEGAWRGAGVDAPFHGGARREGGEGGLKMLEDRLDAAMLSRLDDSVARGNRRKPAPLDIRGIPPEKGGGGGGGRPVARALHFSRFPAQVVSPSLSG